MPARVLPPAALATLVLPAFAFGQPPAPAGLDPEPKAPYLWRVVVQVRPHPLLGATFRDQLRRDLAAALQPGLGPLGTVEVIDLAEVPRDRWDPLWQQFDDKGFPALDAPRELTGVKTHFLRVEVRDGVFHLEARQHDGFTGLASPVVRRQSTQAAELVGRYAGLMVDRDFGIAGTVEPTPGKADEAVVRLRGGQLGPVERFVQVGDVFAVSQVRKTNRPAAEPVRTATGKIVTPPPGSAPPPAYTAAPRDFTLLRVTEAPKDGAVRCQVLTRYQTPFPAGAGVVGYRCLKLATTAAPVAIRLVGGDGRTHQTTSSALSVRATDAGFAAPPAARDNLDFKDGVFRSARPLANVACVTVSAGPTRTERFPLPVLGDAPVTLPFELDPRAAERAAFERAVLSVSAKAADARFAQAACFEAVAKLIQDRKNTEALARARAGLQAADSADKNLGDELARLREQVDRSPAAGQLLDAVERQLAAIRQSNADLAERVKALEEVVARENNPAAAARDVQAQALNTRITLLLGQGEVDQAIVAYDQLATLLPDNAEVKARRDKLREEWKPKSEEHAKAREYLLKTWPALGTVQDFKESLGALRTAVDTCKKAGDKYAFRKLLAEFNAAVVKVNGLTEALDPNSETDRQARMDAQTVREVVGKLEQELAEFVKGQ
jgi:tetratricopeptide (TPR) repeat protein